MVIVVMGVCGCGKSFMGTKLSEILGWEFIEGDSLHPQSNVEKMRQGIPLNDDDRKPWLNKIQERIHQILAEGKHAIVSCSALKQTYRDILKGNNDQVRFLYLKGAFADIQDRLEKRTHHFMNKNLLQSQFDTLEEPTDALVVDCASAPAEIAKTIKECYLCA